ncbi:MAG: Ig-like domain-containing protein, partial [Armatimonadota bacterium]
MMPSLRHGRWRQIYWFLMVAFTLTAIMPTTAFAGPVVQILQPKQGEVVSGVIWIDVSYESASEDPIDQIEIYVDGDTARTWELTNPKTEGTVSFSWDFSFAAATDHTISAKATDTAGATGSATITVTVKRAEAEKDSRGGGQADQTPPVINIYYPAQGAKLSGLTEIRAEARDNVGVQQVYFYIDGRLHKMIYNAPPFYDQWDTTKVADGRHVLEAVAVDAQNNEARSAEVTVFVENHAMTRMNDEQATSDSSTSVTPQSTTDQPDTVSGPGPQIHRTPTETTTPAKTSEPKENRASGTDAPSIPDSPEEISSADTEQAVAANPRAGTPDRVSPASRASSSAVTDYAADRTASTTLPMNADYTVAQRLSRPDTTLPSPEKATGPAADITMFGQSAPVDVDLPAKHTSGLAVADRTATDTVSSTADTSTRPASDMYGRTSTPEHSIDFTPQGKASAPASDVAVSEPVAEPTLADRHLVSSITGGISSGAMTPAAPVSDTVTRPRVSDPGTIDRLAAARTDVEPVDSRTAHAAASTDSDMHWAGQRTTRPQRIDPLPAVASAAATSDAAIPTYVAVNRVRPTADSSFAALPQRIGTPSQRTLETGPDTAETMTADLMMTEPRAASDARQHIAAGATQFPQRISDAGRADFEKSPDVAAGAETPVTTTDSKVAMLPKDGSARLTDARATRPELLQVGKAIASSPVKDVSVMFDDDLLNLRAAPEVVEGIPTGPLRELFEHSDGILYWFPITKEVRAINADTDMHLSIGHDVIDVNGEKQPVSVTPYIKRGRTMVPLQFIADTMDVTIT